MDRAFYACEGVALVEGMAAFGLPIGVQYVVTWSSERAPWVRGLVAGEPQLVATRRDLEAVVFGTDGPFSVVARTEGSGDSSPSLEGVQRRI